MENNKFILDDLKFEINEIQSKVRSIDETKLKMIDWIGKPIHETCIKKIKQWEIEILDHKKRIDYLYKEFKK